MNSFDKMGNKVKPCPFCGSRAEVKYRQKYPGVIDKVVCTHCSARTRRFMPGDTVEKLWNTRTLDTYSERAAEGGKDRWTPDT